MLTMVQPNIFATDTSETSAVRGKINMVYLGTTPYSKPTDLQHADTLSPQKLPDTSTWTADATNGYSILDRYYTFRNEDYGYNGF